MAGLLMAGRAGGLPASLASAQTCCVTLGKSLPFLGPQFASSRVQAPVVEAKRRGETTEQPRSAAQAVPGVETHSDQLGDRTAQLSASLLGFQPGLFQRL